MKNLSKGHFVVRRSKGATALHGAATLTFDHQADPRFLKMVIDGPQRDNAALRGDFQKVLKGLKDERRQQQRELLAG